MKGFKQLEWPHRESNPGTARRAISARESARTHRRTHAAAIAASVPSCLGIAAKLLLAEPFDKRAAQVRVR